MALQKQRVTSLLLLGLRVCLGHDAAQGDSLDLLHQRQGEDEHEFQFEHVDDIHHHDHDNYLIDHDHEHDHSHGHYHSHHHDHDHSHEHSHDHIHKHDHDFDHEEEMEDPSRIKRMALSPDDTVDYYEGNLHHKYIDIEEFEEEEEQDHSHEYDHVHDHHHSHDHHSEDEEHYDTEELFLIPVDWQRLLHCHEIRSQAQLDSLTTDPVHRQASHIFLYFITDDCSECFDRIDFINEAYLRGVASYGADSIVIYKVNGGLFADQFSVHTYPTLVYLAEEPPYTGRLVGLTITPNNLDRFIMESIELNKAPEKTPATDQASSEEGNMDPVVLQAEVEYAMDYIHNLEHALKEVYEAKGVPIGVAGEYEFLEQDELVFQILIEQQGIMLDALHTLLSNDPDAENSSDDSDGVNSTGKPSQTLGEISASLDNHLEKLGEAYEAKTTTPMPNSAISSDWLHLLLVALLGLVIGFTVTVMALNQILLTVEKTRTIGSFHPSNDPEKGLKVAID